MASPQIGVAFAFDFALVSRGTGQFQANPTLATGDFKISKDSAGFVNLASLPVVSPASSKQILVSLSAAEMTFTDRCSVLAEDQAGNEWDDALVTISPSNGTLQVDVTRLGGVTTALERLARSTRGIVLGTVGVGSTATSVVTSALDPAAGVVNQFKDGAIVFDQSTATANLRGVRRLISASTAAGVLTVGQLPTAPANGDTFVIV